MRYVVDASVVVKWFLQEPFSPLADTLLDGFVRQGLTLNAPDIITAEVGNTFWKRSIKRGDLTVLEAEDCFRNFLALNLPTQPTRPLAQRALNLATQEHHQVYDILYVVLALENNCELLTADEHLVNKLEGKFPQIRWIGSFTQF